MNKAKLKKAKELQEQIKAKQERIDNINSGIAQISSGDKQKLSMQVIGNGCINTIEFDAIDPMNALNKEKEKAISELKKLETEFNKLTEKA